MTELFFSEQLDDIAAAREELMGRGLEVTEITEAPGGKFIFFSDPDGNGWSVQDAGRG